MLFFQKRKCNIKKISDEKKKIEEISKYFLYKNIKIGGGCHSFFLGLIKIKIIR